MKLQPFLRAVADDPRDLLVAAGTFLLSVGLGFFGWWCSAVTAGGVLLYIGLFHPLLMASMTRRH